MIHRMKIKVGWIKRCMMKIRRVTDEVQGGDFLRAVSVSECQKNLSLSVGKKEGNSAQIIGVSGLLKEKIL